MVVERIRLDGKNAIVCGAGGGGIGTATSKTLAEAGANIVAVDIDGARVGETVAQVRELGVQALGVVANVETKAGAEQVVAEAERAFGEIHCLANIIGGMTSAAEWNDLFNYGEAEWDAVFSRNLKYQFLIIQAVANHMRRKGIAGSIASLSSVSGWGGAPLHGAYGAAKAGVMALSRTMAIEFGGYGIRVNNLAPGSVITPRTMAATTEEARNKQAAATTPIRRALDPTEIASGLLFLLSDLSSGVSGHTLVVDGGATSKFPFSMPQGDDPDPSSASFFTREMEEGG